ncbi:uncharacterized protein LOC132637495 [Lycium barbarum]|uniref:uncharacterized protein LOC132637495 n=1 Tax=Lycium barbarum TaxID=112863 RepID=UPI00293E1C45|nr:uncharacterized protein LOC132637495 [Lycium barbarum]
MELPECNDTSWKSKFIDGLPALFAERVRKTLRKGEVSINYDNYTYGKLIGTCMQEGLALCNEIKLNQQIKRHGLNKRQQLGEFCEKFVKEKIKNLDIDDDLKESLYKILLNSEPEDSGFESDNSEDSSSNEDLRVLENEDYTSTSSDEECAPCQMGQPCTGKGNKEKDEFYNLFSQFQNTNVNVLDDTGITRSIHHVRSKKKLLQQRRNIITTPAITQDLEKEIDDLKQENPTLKQHNMILDERISRIEDRGKQVMEIPADNIIEDTSVEGSTSKEGNF